LHACRENGAGYSIGDAGLEKMFAPYEEYVESWYQRGGYYKLLSSIQADVAALLAGQM
jgi:hypothetical protein